MIVGLIVGAVAIILVIVAWLTGFFTVIAESLRIGSIEYRRNRTLGAVQEEGRATRELIRQASRQRTRAGLDSWLKYEQRRRSRNRAFGITAIVAVCAIVSVFLVMVWPSSQPSASRSSRPSSQSQLDALISDLVTGDCVNFTNNYVTDALPAHPKIVPCSSRGATFRVAWVGSSSSESSCPSRYSNLTSWTASSGVTACMERVYVAGQCVQGRYEKGYRYSWIDDAVIPCSSAPTKRYPYVVKITGVHGGHYDSCADDYWTGTDPGTGRLVTLCVELLAHFQAGK